MNKLTVKPTVVQVITHLDLGGAESVALSLAEALHEECHFEFFAVLGEADNDVGRGMAERLRRLNIPVHTGTRLEFKRGGVLEAGARLHALLRRLRPDVVHLHTEIPESTYAVSRAFGNTGSRVVRCVHSSTPWPAWQKLGRWVESRLRDAEVVAVSRASWQGLQNFRASVGLPRMPENAAHVIYNGVRGPDPVGPVATDDHPVRVLFAGRFEPEKGAALLPDILDRTRQLVGCSADITLLGHGSLGDRLRSWAERQSAPWTARVSGPIPNLASALREYDVLLMPSRFEGFGIVAVEALLAGTPVVASDVPGLSEVFPPNYPLLAAPDSPESFARLLAAVMENPAHYHALARDLRPYLEERFSVTQMARCYHDLYFGVTAPSGTEWAPA